MRNERGHEMEMRTRMTMRIGPLGYIPHCSPVIYLPQRSWGGGGGGDSRVTCPSLHLSVWIVESLVRLSICLCPDFVWTISSESLNLFVTKLAVIKTGLCRLIGDVLWTRKIQMFECLGFCRICGGNTEQGRGTPPVSRLRAEFSTMSVYYVQQLKRPVDITRSSAHRKSEICGQSHSEGS